MFFAPSFFASGFFTAGFFGIFGGSEHVINYPRGVCFNYRITG